VCEADARQSGGIASLNHRLIAATPAGSVVGWAPGKVILLGEHAVVYGRPALAASIEQGLRVSVWRRVPSTITSTSTAALSTSRLREALVRAAGLFAIAAEELEVEVDSSLPQGVGLGSSAALSVALVRALGQLAGVALDEHQVAERSFELERIFHGHPSGIDNTVCAHGGLISFSRADGFRPLACARPLRLVIAIGSAVRETRRVVGALRQRWEDERERHEAMFDEIAALVRQGETALASGDCTAFGEIVNANQQVLARLDISTPELDEMIDFARRNGALGAKLTGGGGGGAIICLAGEHAPALASAFEKQGRRAFVTEVPTR